MVRTTWKAVSALLLLCVGCFSNVGCIDFRQKAGEVAEGLLDRGKEWVQEEVADLAPKLEEKMTSLVEKKLADAEEKNLKMLDEQMALLGTRDEVTGALVCRNWRDFDLDKSGHLEGAELLKVTTYITNEGYKRYQAGELTKEQFLGMEKKTAVGVTSLGGIATTAALIAWRRRRKSGEPEEPGAPPEPPSPEPVPKPA